MKSDKKTLAVCIIIPLAVGGLAGILSRGSMDVFAQLAKPPFSPPGWLFPVVWTILYILMGIASYLVIESGAEKEKIDAALRVYGIQLVVQFLWPLFFFNFGWYLFSFLWLVFLWVLILKTIQLFSECSKTAGRLLVPYLLWVTYAGYLNLFIYLLA